MKRTAKNKNILLLAILAVVVVGTGVYIKTKQSSYTPSSTADTAVHAGPKTDTSPPPATAAATQPNPSHPATTTLAKPIGPTNNTSTISLSGPTTMESVCRAEAGAACFIQATKDGQTIRVSDAKVVGSTAGSDGVILNWDAKLLAKGQWSIQAVATKDGQTASSDPQTLMVNP